MKSIRETDIQKAVCDYLAYKGYFFWRSNNIPAFQSDKYGSRFRAMPKYSMNGIADIIVIMDGGQAIFIEVKRPGGIQSFSQKQFENKCKEKGAKYYVLTDINQLKEIGL